jgi:lipoprotein-anchoring transpeptidase ErfK/SrfK
LCFETTAATLAIGTRTREQRDMEHLQRRVVGGLRWQAPKPLGGRENSMISTSRFVLRGALAAAIVVFASVNSGTTALAQQVAVNTEDGANGEDQTAREPSPDEERPTHAETRQVVPFHTSEAPETIIVDTGERYLYLVQPNGQAIRYGIGVGRLGFQWSGVERVSQKQEWPDWRVPAEMIGRQPYLPRFMAGGPGNPLGARALYLGHTVFRIHGTTSRRRSDTLFRRDAFASTTPM